MYDGKSRLLNPWLVRSRSRPALPQFDCLCFLSSSFFFSEIILNIFFLFFFLFLFVLFSIVETKTRRNFCFTLLVNIPLLLCIVLLWSIESWHSRKFRSIVIGWKVSFRFYSRLRLRKRDKRFLSKLVHHTVNIVFHFSQAKETFASLNYDILKRDSTIYSK